MVVFSSDDNLDERLPYPFPLPPPPVCGPYCPGQLPPAGPSPQPSSTPPSSSPSKAKYLVIRNLVFNLLHCCLVASLVVLWWRTRDLWVVMTLVLLVLHFLLVYFDIIVHRCRTLKE